jgi:hypothetical protein
MGIALVGLVVATLVAPASAELQRVEAVGIYGIRDSMRSKVIPRDEAVAAARWEGVSRVALELIRESSPDDTMAMSEDPDPGDTTDAAPAPDDLAALRKALGGDVLPYTRSYRILEDRGESPALFNDEPDVDVEYVVVVEIIVDVDRLTAALADAGLIARSESGGGGEAVLLEVVGLSRYPALVAIRQLLTTQLGATRVQMLEFSPKRQLLAVESALDAEALLARLGRLEHPELVLEPVAADPARGRARVVARWFPVEASEVSPPG